MKTSKPFIVRQGDVLLKKIDKLPAGAIKQEICGSRMILAHGESSGHSHSIAKHGVNHFTVPDTQATIVEVAEALALLEHQEHSTIELPKGLYEVVIQREYHPQEIRRVVD